MALREDLHPLPGTWIELREQVAKGAALGKIGRGIAAKTSGLALAKKASVEDWREIARCCLLDYDDTADEKLRQIVREIRRRPTR